MSSDAAPISDKSEAMSEKTVVPAIDLQPKSQPSAALAGGSLRTLGRRISSRTTDLLAIAIVVAASLTLGRQMLTWWHEAPPAVLEMGPLEERAAEWGSDSRPVSLEFGNSPMRVMRQALTGTNQLAALESVRERCQKILVTAAAPVTAIDTAEADQLAAISKLTPVAEQPGNWQIYLMSGGLPMFVGVKTFADTAPKKVADRAPESRRVICWGLVFPGLSPGSWTTYTFEKRSANADNSAGAQSQTFDLSQLKLPAGAQRTVLMQESGQGGLLGFQGVNKADAWQQHFSNGLAGHGWKQVDDWRPINGGWSNQFARREMGQLEDSTIQIHFYPQQTDQSVGLIQWVPGREPRAEPSPMPKP